MKLVILDRDGVINEDSNAYIRSAAEWLPIDGSLDAVARLKSAGYTVVVATNQSGIGRGLFGQTALTAMHDKMTRLLAAHGGAKLDGIFVCPHKPTDGCDCRKPAPGLLWQISRRFDVALADVPVIGDSARDMQAAQAVGACPMLVLTGKGRQTAAQLPATIPRFANLAAAVTALLQSNP